MSVNRREFELARELGVWIMKQDARIKSAGVNFHLYSLCGAWASSSENWYPFTVGVSCATLEDRGIWPTFLRWIVEQGAEAGEHNAIAI